MTHVVFAIPSTRHEVQMNFMVSMIETDRLMILNNFAITYLPIGGDCFPWKVRSKLASMFLDDFPDATDLFFLDDDIGWPAHKVLEFLKRPEPILVGAYPKKQDLIGFPIDLWAGEDGKPLYQNGLYRAVSAGAGFMRIKREVLENLREIAPVFTEQGSERQYTAFFTEGVVNGEAWGEDKYFCALAQQAGYPVWADADIPFTHQGRKRWEGNLADHLRIQFPEPEIK